MDDEKTPEMAAERAAQTLMGGLERIREIIVEPRVHRTEEALESVDRRRAKEVSELHRALERSLDRLDAFVKKESEALDNRLATERRERSASVTELGGKTVVFVREREGEFELHEVTLGREALGKVEVLEGLREGEEVVSDGVFTLKSLVLKGSFAEGHGH